MITLNGSCADYRGLSTDTKPSDAGENALSCSEELGGVSITGYIKGV